MPDVGESGDPVAAMGLAALDPPTIDRALSY